MDYLALIRKADFTDLFKYGFLHINKDMITEFTCSVEDLPNREPLFKNISFFSNQFESSFTYLIIHYVKEGEPSREKDVKIEDVRHIYPLDVEAKKELEGSFDERIRIEEPLWENALVELQKKQTVSSCKQGIKNVWKVFDLKGDPSTMSDIIPDSIINEVVDELYSGRRPSGELPLWVYLLRYERHAYYPQSTIGYFMDTIHIVCNMIAGREVFSTNVEGTEIYKYVDLLPKETQYKDLCEIIESADAAKNFIERINLKCVGADFLRVAPMFLRLRDDFTEGLDMSKDMAFLEYTKANFEHEFKVASYLLGIVLGHDKTYDCFYEYSKLAIFKKKESNADLLETYEGMSNLKFNYMKANTSDVTEELLLNDGKLTSAASDNQTNKQGNLFGYGTDINQIEFPCKIIKLTQKTGMKSKGKKSNQVVNNQQELNKYMEKFVKYIIEKLESN